MAARSVVKATLLANGQNAQPVEPDKQENAGCRITPQVCDPIVTNTSQQALWAALLTQVKSCRGGELDETTEDTWTQIRGFPPPGVFHPA